MYSADLRLRVFWSRADRRSSKYQRLSGYHGEWGPEAADKLTMYIHSYTISGEQMFWRLSMIHEFERLGTGAFIIGRNYVANYHISSQKKAVVTIALSSMCSRHQTWSVVLETVVFALRTTSRVRGLGLSFPTEHTVNVKTFLTFFLIILSRFYVLDVFFILPTFILLYFILIFLSNTCRPARQSIVTTVCVSACNCRRINYLW